MANEIKVKLTLEQKQAVKALTALTKKTKKFGDDSEKSFRKTSRAMDVFKGVLLSTVATRGFDFLARSAREAGRNFLELSIAIAEINSILPANEKLTQASTDAFIKFSDSFAGTAQTQAKAFYAIVSAGVKTTSKQLQVLKIANKAAVAGLVDISIAAGVLVSSVNSYANSALTAEQASDTLFIAVREGQTTFGELASTLGSVAPLAAAAGIKFDELAGTLAFITKSGVRTDEAVTGLKAIIAGVIKPSEQAAQAAKNLGLDFSTAAIRAKGFGKFLEDIRIATGGSEVELAKLFPNIRALGAVLNITRGNFKDFKRILQETATAAGATDTAFQVISKSASFQFKRLVQQLENLPQAFLKNFDEPIAQVIKSIRELVSGNGILLVIDAVDLAIIAFTELASFTAKVGEQFLIIKNSGLGLIETYLELESAAISAQIAAKRFLNLDTSGAEKFLEVTNERLIAIKNEIGENERAVDASIDADNKRFASADALREKLKAGREKQIEDNKTANDQLLQDDKDAIDDKTDLGKKESDQLKALREQESIAADEANLAKKEQATLEADEDFKFLQERLGTEAAIKEVAIIKAEKDDDKRKQKRVKARIKAQKAERDSESKQVSFFALTQKEKFSAAATTSGLLVDLAKSSGKENSAAGKVLAIADATIQGIVGVQRALASAAPPLNLVNASIIGAIAATNVNKIRTTGFQEGGIVGGNSFSGDNIPIRVNSAEEVLTRRDRSIVSQALGGGGSGGDITINIEGNILGNEEFTQGLIQDIRDMQELRNAEGFA